MFLIYSVKRGPKDRQLQLKPIADKAIEIYATHAGIEHTVVAEMLGVSTDVLYRLRRSPDFWSKVYDSYMVAFEGDVVDVLKSMVREAKAGNVMAGRLVLEHSGKLQKNINVTVNSPFEKWLHKSKDVADAEIVDEFQDLPAKLSDFSTLPERKVESQSKRGDEERKNIAKVIRKKASNASRSQTRKIMREWKKRAKTVGVEELPRGRPTPGQRFQWEQEIIRREKKASEPQQEQAGSNNTPCKQKNQKPEDQ